MAARKASTPVRSPKKQNRRKVGRPRGTQAKNWNRIIERLNAPDAAEVISTNMLTAKSASATAYYLNTNFSGIKACSNGKAVRVRKEN